MLLFVFTLLQRRTSPQALSGGRSENHVSHVNDFPRGRFSGVWRLTALVATLIRSNGMSISSVSLWPFPEFCHCFSLSFDDTRWCDYYFVVTTSNLSRTEERGLLFGPKLFRHSSLMLTAQHFLWFTVTPLNRAVTETGAEKCIRELTQIHVKFIVSTTFYN
jgi:hypothetical protein